jgi:hypothetical protein
MAISNARPGLPDPASVVEEIPFGGTEGVGGAPAYRILRTTELDEYEELEGPELEAKKKKKKAPGEQFGGTSRRVAKLSLINAQVEAFTDVSDLIDTLPDHADMQALDISTDADSNRVEEESRNVRVDAFIYAASIEDDNDYHLIVGRDPEADGGPMYITMELSGLPPANMSSHAALKKARDAFKKYFADFFDGQLPGTRYDFYDPPIRVQIEGPLFLDASHATGGRPGPQSLRDDIPTVWEVHPIGKMKLFPPAE